MPSRKRSKGQARKAKSKKEDVSVIKLRPMMRGPMDKLVCNHGIIVTNEGLPDEPSIVTEFMGEFFQLYKTCRGSETKVRIVGIAKRALKDAYDRFPEAVNNQKYLDFVKRNFISTGTQFILHDDIHISRLAIGIAAALMYIDSYSPSSPVLPGTIDKRDAKDYMRNLDIMNGCQRSLVKIFVKQIPCNCLDELYARVKSVLPKIGKCWGCNQTKERSELYICTGCERVMYCSKKCQLEHVPKHKQACKKWQSKAHVSEVRSDMCRVRRVNR